MELASGALRMTVALKTCSSFKSGTGTVLSRLQKSSSVCEVQFLFKRMSRLQSASILANMYTKKSKNKDRKVVWIASVI